MINRNNMNYLASQDLPKRLLFALMFASFFAVIGWAIPEIYYRHFDSLQYLQIEQPISVDKKIYEPCERTILTTKMKALVDLDVKSLTQLVLTNENGDEHRIGDIINAEAPVRANGSHVVSGALPLPCDVKSGQYYWLGNASYEVHGVHKDLSFISETFTIEVGRPNETEQEEEGKDCSPIVGCL